MAEAVGITIPISKEQQIAATEAIGAHKTSMLQDIERGKSTEADALVGAVSEIGRLVNVPTPRADALYALVKLASTLERRGGRRGGRLAVQPAQLMLPLTSVAVAVTSMATVSAVAMTAMTMPAMATHAPAIDIDTAEVVTAVMAVAVMAMIVELEVPVAVVLVAVMMVVVVVVAIAVIGKAVSVPAIAIIIGTALAPPVKMPARPAIIVRLNDVARRGLRQGRYRSGSEG